MLFYIFQLQCALEGNKDNITMTIILSMKKSEIEAHVDKVSNSPSNENLNLLVRIKFLKYSIYTFVYLNKN
jgi:hypothetical protein